MKKKDINHQLVMIGVGLFLSGFCFNIITLIFSVLLSFSYIALILIVIGIILAVVGGLRKEKK
jgi:hypothetical protein